MAEQKSNHLNDLMALTMEKIREMADSNTIIGNPITMQDGTTIIPVSRVTFGFASGGSDIGSKSAKDLFGGGSGAGVSMSPVAFLVIKDGNVRTIQLAEGSSLTDRAIMMIPELLDRLGIGKKPGKDQEKETVQE